MSKPETNTDHEGQSGDNLRDIKGIGKSIAEALNKFGIWDFADLAKSNPDQLMDMLKGRLPQIALQKASPESWIEQARSLVEEERSSELAARDETASTSLDPTSHPPETPSTTRKGWREIADFFISFGYEDDESGKESLMTKAHYSQADKQMQWPGLVTGELLQWLREQAPLPLETGSGNLTRVEGAALAAQEETGGAIQVVLSNLWVSEVQAPASGSPGAQTSLLKVSSNLSLSGPDSESYVQDRLEYAVDVLLVNTKNNQANLVSTYSSRMRPAELVYQVQQTFPVPTPGRYELYLIARMPAPVEPITYLQGPLIRVEN
jgi:hypothetical protein